MAVTFDGEQLLIILETGVTEVDWRDDVYAEWKIWQRENRPDGSSNRGYPQAFRVTAGDPLTGALDSGGYFFLQNQNGWRIRPAEEDATILVTSNLVPEDSTLPLMTPTIGGFTVLIVGLVPVTQNVERIAPAVWDEFVASHVVAGTVGNALRLIQQVTAGFTTVSPDGSLITVFDIDGTSVIATLSVDPTQRIQKRLT